MTKDRFSGPTGHPLEYWLTLLQKELGPATEASHKDMARFFASQDGISDWWAQGITVAIEQQIGRRVVGQTCSGTFSASASKTVAGEWLPTFEKFVRFMESPENLPLVATSAPSTSSTEKWRYWRANLSDGSKVVINCQSRAPGKVTFGVSHDNLEADAREPMKQHWRETLNRFAQSIS